MTLREFCEGLEILRSHFPDSEGYPLGAEHDEIHVYSTETPLTEEEVTKMKALGWVQYGLNEEDPYDPDETWVFFV